MPAWFVLILLLAPALCAQVRSARNFGQVEEGVLYRGAQPSKQALAELQRFGIRTVLDLRNDDTVGPERAAVEDLGMKFVNAPLKGLSAPTPQQIHQILDLLDTLPKPIFVHCQHGQDRTGTVVACRRISHEPEKWSNTRALREAEAYGMSRLQFAMKQFILHYQP